MTEVDDLNNIKENGIYYFSTNSVPRNSFYKNASVLEVFGSESINTQKIQRITRYGIIGESAFRPLSAGEWLDWTSYMMKTIQIGTALADSEGRFSVTFSYQFQKIPIVFLQDMGTEENNLVSSKVSTVDKSGFTGVTTKTQGTVVSLQPNASFRWLAIIL